MNRFEQFGEHPAFEYEQPDKTEKETNSSEKLIQKSGEAFLELESDFDSIETALIKTPDSSRLNEIKQQAEDVLKVAAKKILRWSRNAALTGLLAVSYAAVDLHEQGHFEDKEKAHDEMTQTGITHEQRISAYKPGISELIYRGVTPFSYQEGASSTVGKYLDEKGVPGMGAIEHFVPNVIHGRENLAKKHQELNTEYYAQIKEIQEDTTFGKADKKDQLESLKKEFEDKFSAEGLDMNDMTFQNDMSNALARDDAWRMYLGLPQQHDTFDISNYKPSSDTEDAYYFKIKDFWESFSKQYVQLEYTTADTVRKKIKPEEEDEYQFLRSPESGIKGKVELIQKLGHNNKLVVQDTDIGENGGDVMHAYTLAMGHDEKGNYLSYYDKWDLSSKLADNPLTKGVGNAFEMYDRLYYDDEFNIVNP